MINPETITLPEHLKGRVFFTAKEFGGLVGKSAETVKRWRRMGWLKGQQFSPRCVMYSLSDLGRYMRGEMMEPAACAAGNK